nr:hypothetical protein [Mycoplasmopsis bovis]
MSIRTLKKIVQDALQNSIMKNKTSFVIAHRLSTIKDADLILVVNDGQIIEKGNHKELMVCQGLLLWFASVAIQLISFL